MTIWDDQPVFCFTSDIDWCTDVAWQTIHKTYVSHNIRPTYFLTHDSPFLSTLKNENSCDFGIHPNFVSGSSHGSSTQEIIKTVLDISGPTQLCRTHRYIDGNDWSYPLYENGIRIDVTGCTRQEYGIRPLMMNSGIIKVFTFWEDGSYSEYAKDWSLNTLKNKLRTPGIKVFNTHPTNFAFNVQDRKFYQYLKENFKNKGWINATQDEIQDLEQQGNGPKTLLPEVLRYIHDQKFTVMTLNEILQHYSKSH